MKALQSTVAAKLSNDNQDQLLVIMSEPFWTFWVGLVGNSRESN